MKHNASKEMRIKLHFESPTRLHEDENKNFFSHKFYEFEEISESKTEMPKQK